MDSAEILVTSGGLGLIAFTLWFFLARREEVPSASGSRPLYACPMHPWITSHDPMATCSICGMKLTSLDEATAQK